MVNLSELRERVQILRQQVIEEDEGLGEEIAFQPFKKIWAKPLKQRITPQVSMDNTEVVIVTQGFQIRSGNDIQKSDRLVWQNNTYKIIDVDTSNPFYYILTTKRVEL